MADVKWIKLTVDMFDNRKIKHIRKMPEGNNIVLIWVMLLTLAGRCNAGGMIFLTESIHYTTKMLADELGFEEGTIQLALNVLAMLGMIATNNDVIEIPAWEEYQNVDGLAKIREQNRIRQKEYYDRRKRFGKPNVSLTLDITQPNAIDIDKEEDKELSIYTHSDDDASKEKKHKYGTYKHVLLTDAQYEKLFEAYGEPLRTGYINKLDEYIETSGKRYKNHYFVITKDGSWVRETHANKRAAKAKDAFGIERGTDYTLTPLERIYGDDNGDSNDILEELRGM